MMSSLFSAISLALLIVIYFSKLRSSIKRILAYCLIITAILSVVFISGTAPTFIAAFCWTFTITLLFTTNRRSWDK